MKRSINLQALRQDISSTLSKIRDTSDEFTSEELKEGKETDLHESCIKKMKTHRDALIKIKCPDAVMSDKEKALEEAESYFQRVSKC